MAGGKVYSFQEVGKHNSRKDCWLVIAGKVYDVTAFMEEHPGGDEVLLACTGNNNNNNPLHFPLSSMGDRLMCSRRKINSLTQSPPPPSFRAGKDATADFEDIGHSDDAKEMMPQYLIGELDAATVPAKLAYAYASDAGATRSSTGAAGAWATLLRLAVPVLLLALALGMQSYGKAKAE
ncbi:unnamed protein product [Urochloa decumbens]|uniref:Cytochrome b5 heme-binding domain-containing protein n=1 Tax=Urochloa decumbens TaxID=240449 RepID=A0ABC9EGG4_9POAL